MALQAIGSLKICTGFLMVMVSVAFLGHIRMRVLAGVENGVMGIQTSGDICVGKFTSEVFLICNEHCEVIAAGPLVYRAVTHDGGFAKGWKGVSYTTKLTICFSADLKLGSGKFYCHGCILGNT